jgi:hypothetical protein
MSTVYSQGGKSQSGVHGARNYTSPKAEEYKRYEGTSIAI